MKIKNDFVTNSSSCSFILLGFSIPYNRNYEEIENRVKKIGNSFFVGCGTEGGSNSDDKAIVGKILLEIDDYSEYTELDLNTNIDDVIELAKEFDIEKEKIKYIVGSRLC